MFVTTSRLACRRVLQMARGATYNNAVWQRKHPTLTSMPSAAPQSQTQSSLSTLTLTVVPSTPPTSIVSSISGWLENLSQAIWLIKRTFQPSLVRKKRKSGYLKRRQTVGGRRILKRRKAKGRARLFGA